MSKYSSFPGYDRAQAEKDERKKQKEQKIAARQEKRRNTLPPFLMVRAGVYNHVLWESLLVLGGVAATKIPAGTIEENAVKFLLITICFGIAIGTFAPLAEDKARRVKPYIERIKNAVMQYGNGESQSLEINATEHKNMTAALIRHLAKNNPAIFKKMIENPESVTDMDIATNIVLGHIKSHPKDALVAMDKFWYDTVPGKLRRKLEQVTYLHNYSGKKERRN